MNKLIAIVGMSGSGKSIATDYLEKNNWKKIYFGGKITKPAKYISSRQAAGYESKPHFDW